MDIQQIKHLIISCHISIDVCSIIVHVCKMGMCNCVKCAQGAHFDMLSKTVPKGVNSHANSVKNRQRKFMQL